MEKYNGSLVYNVPVEVTEAQYRRVIKSCEGIIAHRVDENGKYLIILWMPKYKQYVINELNKI